MPYFTHGDTKSKLLLLTILQLADTPLTHEQLYRTSFSNDCMDYFTFETVLPELEEDGFLAAFPRSFGACYGLTDAGRDALKMFADSIPHSQREKLSAYLSLHRDEFLREAQVSSSMAPDGLGGYSLRLSVQENEQVIFGITLSVASQEAALAMRSNWNAQSGALYDLIWDKLMHNDAPTNNEQE